MGQKRRDQKAGGDRAEAPEKVDQRECGAGVCGPAAAGEDVGAGDDLAQTETADEQRRKRCGEAMREGEDAESGGGQQVAGEDAQPQTAGDGDTACKGPGELGEQKKAAALVRQRPLMQKLRQERPEQHGSQAGEKEAGR